MPSGESFGAAVPIEARERLAGTRIVGFWVRRQGRSQARRTLGCRWALVTGVVASALALERGRRDEQRERICVALPREREIPIGSPSAVQGAKGAEPHQRNTRGMISSAPGTTAMAFISEVSRRPIAPESARRWRRVARSCRSRLRSTALLTSRTGCSAGRPS